MHYPSLSAMIDATKRRPLKGPIALILIEDDIEIASTLTHHAKAGFGALLVFCLRETILPDDLPENLHRIDFDVMGDNALPEIANAMINAVPGQWLYVCYNAEYLFYPFCENRSVGEMLGFMSEERRGVVFNYMVDLYAKDLSAHPNGVDPQTPFFDKTGYYALARENEAFEPLERQINVFGGLRWRFEDHIPKSRQRTDRVSFFQATQGLEMLPDRSFSIAEYNTYACPWHNSLTTAIASFRTAKALRRNPGSREVIETFHWPNAEPFVWQSQQLLDLGLMEPGQWF